MLVNLKGHFVTQNFPIEDLGGERPTYASRLPRKYREAPAKPRRHIDLSFPMTAGELSSTPASPNTESEVSRGKQAKDKGKAVIRPAVASSSRQHGGYDRAHNRNNSSLDNSFTLGTPLGKGMMRVLYGDTLTKVISIAGCVTVDQVMRLTLKKFSLPEEQAGNYCFWAQAPGDPGPRRLGDMELWNILQGEDQPERNRLILQRVQSEEPKADQFSKYIPVSIYDEDDMEPMTMERKSHKKVRKVLGDEWDGFLPPLAPIELRSNRRSKYMSFVSPSSSNIEGLKLSNRYESGEEDDDVIPQFAGMRPPSELIASSLGMYFPQHDPEYVENTARMSVRRSKRLSKINSRLSVASTGSFASSSHDVPPIPSIADQWLSGNVHIAKLREDREAKYRSHAIYGRESISASVLETLKRRTGKRADLESLMESELEDTESNMTYSDTHSDAESEETLSEKSYSRHGARSETDAADNEDDTCDESSDDGTIAGARHSRDASETLLTSQSRNGLSNRIELGIDGGLQQARQAPTVTRLSTGASSNRVVAIRTDEVTFNRRDRSDADGEVAGGHSQEQTIVSYDVGQPSDGREENQLVHRSSDESENDVAQDDDDDDDEDEDDADDVDLSTFLAGESWDDSLWMKGALIGKGSFGKVYLALHSVTGELLAVKQVDSSVGNEDERPRKKSMMNSLKREIVILRELRHPNIVQYFGCSSGGSMLNIFLEYVPGGSVQTMLDSYGALGEPLIRSFVRQILSGLSYLHGRGIVHRDIKGANVLVDNKGCVKISDFGISKKLDKSNLIKGVVQSAHMGSRGGPRVSLQGSVFWMAPEVLKQTGFTSASDIWSLGCLVVEMMTAGHPYPEFSQLQALFNLLAKRITPQAPEGTSKAAIEFLEKCFDESYDRRPTADTLLLSPWLVQIPM